jgi:hypothetical protein
VNPTRGLLMYDSLSKSVDKTCLFENIVAGMYLMKKQNNT